MSAGVAAADARPFASTTLPDTAKVEQERNDAARGPVAHRRFGLGAGAPDGLLDERASEDAGEEDRNRAVGVHGARAPLRRAPASGLPGRASSSTVTANTAVPMPPAPSGGRASVHVLPASPSGVHCHPEVPAPDAHRVDCGTVRVMTGPRPRPCPCSGSRAGRNAARQASPWRPGPRPSARAAPRRRQAFPVSPRTRTGRPAHWCLAWRCATSGAIRTVPRCPHGSPRSRSLRDCSGRSPSYHRSRWRSGGSSCPPRGRGRRPHRGRRLRPARVRRNSRTRCSGRRR